MKGKNVRSVIWRFSFRNVRGNVHHYQNNAAAQIPEEKYNAIKYHIILGGGSFMRPGLQKQDEKMYMELARNHFPILCVLGNREPIYGIMEKMPEADIGKGENVYRIHACPFVAYLKRGKAYTIDGFKFLVLGGAQSLES